ncbi:MAG: hypothetical protein LBQ83_03675 [Candidatus Margulisbacteria bacterium]|jgi:hypothetical protein|nr:hypothetical protein [Candidatus Margulisiibacteriota bacterium]
MINIQKMIDIPDEHRIYLDVPAEIPAGAAYIELTVIPSPGANTRKPLAAYFGALKDSKVFAGDAVAIQRKIRAEWDR